MRKPSCLVFAFVFFIVMSGLLSVSQDAVAKEKEFTGSLKKAPIPSIKINRKDRPVFRVISNKKTIGTAFLYRTSIKKKPYHFLITAAHVMSGADSNNDVWIENKALNLHERVTKQVRLDVKTDVCLLILRDYSRFDSIEALKGAPEDLFVDDDVVAYGYSAFEPKITDIEIASRGYILTLDQDGEFFTFLNVLSKGGSGSPLLSQEGDVIGMISQRLLVGEPRQYIGIANAITIHKINTLLADYISSTAK